MIAWCVALLAKSRLITPTRTRIDNKSAHGVLTGIMEQKRTKSTDMNANWVKDCCGQGQFDICWAPGKTYLAVTQLSTTLACTIADCKSPMQNLVVRVTKNILILSPYTP